MSNPWEEYYKPKTPYDIGLNFGVPLETLEQAAIDAVAYQFSPHTRFEGQEDSYTVTTPYSNDLLHWGILFARGLNAELLLPERIKEGKASGPLPIDLEDPSTLPEGAHISVLTESIGKTYRLLNPYTLNNSDYASEEIVRGIGLMRERDENGEITCRVRIAQGPTEVRFFDERNKAVKKIFSTIQERIATYGQYKPT